MLQIRDFSVRIAGRLLIDSANLSIPAGARAGLVGRNGTGKTTLFKAITGEIGSESGDVGFPSNWRVGQVEQEAPGTSDSLLEIVLSADKERTALLNEAEGAQDPARIADIQARLAAIEAYSAEARAASILSGLGFSHNDQSRPASDFSGGWRMRVALAAVLFSRPDLLLLDEPTNYLDLEGTFWLETYLKTCPGTLIIISHDRDLLERCTNAIVHLENRKLKFYSGSFDSFERQYNQQRELDLKTREKMEAQARHMQTFVDRFRYKASKARQAQSRIKAIEKLKMPELLEQAGTRPISFRDPEVQASSPLIKLENVNCGYSADRPILAGLDLRIDADDRIALLGANGNGKSTFAKLLDGRLDHVSGEIVKPPKIKVAMFTQHQMDDLRDEETPIEHLKRTMPNAPEKQVRAAAARMGLDGDRMATRAGNLSGGEKARLLLGLVGATAPDLLILDEPTNHLDMNSREALIHGLNAYQGAVILISHDRHLIDATTERLWLVENGQVQPFAGDLDAYRREVLGGKKADRANAAPAAAPPPAPKRDAAEQRRKLAPLRQKISEKEKVIQSLEAEISKIDSLLADPATFEQNAEKGAALAIERAKRQSRLEAVESEWLELGEALAEMTGT